MELIGGEILDVGEWGPRHSSVVMWLHQLLFRRVGDSGIVSVKHPVRFDQYTEPIADISILKPREDFYSEAHPGATDVFLMIEVADVSIDFDREAKAPLYAAAGIHEYWLVDLTANAVRVHVGPVGEVYQGIEECGRGSVLTASALPELTLSVDEIFR